MSKMAVQEHAAFRAAFASLLYFTVAVVVWCFVNLAIALGIFFILFVMLANASFLGFFTEIDNLADHYLAAGSAARVAFQLDFMRSFITVFMLVCLIRGPYFIQALRGGFCVRSGDTL
jgi:hypothetical protein